MTPHRARFHVAMERSMEVKTTCSIGTENDYLRHSTWLELVPSQSMRRISKSHGPPIVTTEVTWVFYHSHEHLANTMGD